MTSFAKTISATPIKAEPSQTKFENVATRKGEPSIHGSEMVARDKPHPAPRPSPEIAGEVDRAAFNAAWKREQRHAAFIKERTDPETGGQVRVFNRQVRR